MKRLIVGVDPGTTVGIALLGTDGELIAVQSKKEWDVDSVVEWIRHYGTVVVAGTDKAKIPSFVSDIATAFSARVIHPREDLKSDGKAKSADCRNAHEQDAFASALVAFKRYERVLSNIAKFARAHDKEEMTEELQELVIKHGMNRSAALTYFEKPEAQPKVVQEITKREPTSREVIRLYNELIEWKEKLQERNADLVRTRNTLSKARKEQSALQKQLNALLSKKAQKQKQKFKRERWQALEKKVAVLQEKLDFWKSQVEEVSKFIGMDVAIVKKLRSLNAKDIENLMKSPAQYVIVDNPSEFSERSLSLLRGVYLISKRNFPSSVRSAANTATVKDIEGQDFGAFLLIENSVVDSWFKTVDVRKLFEEYRNSRR